MQPAIVMPLHDPDGVIYPHLAVVMPQLKTLFAAAYLAVPAATQRAYPEQFERLAADPFCRLCWLEGGLQVGEQFATLYRFAAAACPPRQVLHLCFPDRVSFALESDHAAAFSADMRETGPADTPLIFQRTAAAWQTHPANYHEIESFATRIGELLFGRTLDFGWCHLAIGAERLAGLLPRLHARDLSMVGEMVVLLRHEIKTRDVDWLAWEDPLVLGADPAQLKHEREASPQEVRKRLSYVLPTVQRLLEAEG